MAGVQAGVHDRLQEGDQVSIPQSGWRGFKRKSQQGQLQLFQGFNPSVGMAGVQARTGATATSGTVWFQSLSRDGGGSSLGDVRLDVDQGLGFNPSVGMAGVQAWLISQSSMGVVVSIPQSGWRGFKRGRKWLSWITNTSFNPSVGMAGVQAGPISGGYEPLIAFNPSVGMAGVQAPLCMDVQLSGNTFQSLSRDGGGSSRPSAGRTAGPPGFNPSVGMAGVQAGGPDHPAAVPDGFNPSVGMAGVQALEHGWEI